MSAGLKDLLSIIRQHPCFKELLDSVEAPMVRPYKSSSISAQDQWADWILRSGRQQQNILWRDFLTNYVPQVGDKPEDKP